MLVVGDVVEFVGFPDLQQAIGIGMFGIIVRKDQSPWSKESCWYQVMWQDGRFGNMLYPQTLKKVAG